MSEFQKDIERIKNPENIRAALYASGPTTLMRAFERDPTVIRLVRGGSKVIPLISAEISKNGLKLDAITLCCFAYVLQKTDAVAAATVLRPLFVQAMRNPDPFFVYFAAHVLRQDLKLPFKPDDPQYTLGELHETLAWVERTKKTEQRG